MYIKKGDRVKIICGKNKNEESTVLKVIREEGRVIVKDINIVTRHHKKTAQSQSGITKKERPIDISNVALIDPASKKPTRIKIKKENGKKIRISCRSGKEIKS